MTASKSSAPRTAWRAALDERLPLLGHRNWIVVADSAYPWQASAGIETIHTGADHVEVVRGVLEAIAASRHVRPVVHLDAELPLVPETHAPGVTACRRRWSSDRGYRNRFAATRGDHLAARRGGTRLPDPASQDDAHAALHLGLRAARLRVLERRGRKGAPRRLAIGHPTDAGCPPAGLAWPRIRTSHGPDTHADEGSDPAGQQHGGAAGVRRPGARPRRGPGAHEELHDLRLGHPRASTTSTSARGPRATRA